MIRRWFDWLIRVLAESEFERWRHEEDTHV